MDYDDLLEMYEDLLADHQQLRADYDKIEAVGEARNVMLASALEKGIALREDKRAVSALADFYRRFGPAR